MTDPNFISKVDGSVFIAISASHTSVSPTEATFDDQSQNYKVEDIFSATFYS
jgi:hypothetical protein